MPKNRTAIRLGDTTMQQLDDIAAKFGLSSRTAAIEFAANELWVKSCMVSKEHQETLDRIAELERLMGLKPGEMPKPAAATVGQE